MKRLILLVCLLLFSTARADIYHEPPRENWDKSPLLRITAFSAGQSDCILVECGGDSMMIDGGTEAYAQALVSAMEGRSFQYMLNTHFHEDHLSGLIALLEAGNPVETYLHPYPNNAVYLSPLHRRAVNAAANPRQLMDGEEIMLGEANIRFMRYDDGKSTNGRSVVVRIDFGSASILLPADIIGDTQTWLCQTYPEMLNVDILKAPHHAVSVMTNDFLDMTSPEMVLITNDRVKSAEGWEQLQRKNIPAVFTSDGRVILETDGQDWVILQ